MERRAEGTETASEVAAQIDVSDAQARLDRAARGGRFSLRRWITREPARVRVELVHLPSRLIGDPASDARLLIDGHARRARWLRAGIELLPSEAPIDYPIGIEETRAIAEDALRRAKLARIAGARATLDLDITKLVHWPYWARYAESRRGRITFAMIDAVDGRIAGPETRRAWIEVLRRRARGTSNLGIDASGDRCRRTDKPRD